MKESERWKGQVPAADAWRDKALCTTEVIIGMIVS